MKNARSGRFFFHRFEPRGILYDVYMTRLPARLADDVFGLLLRLAAQVLDHVDVRREERLEGVADLLGDLGRVTPFGEEQTRKRMPEVIDADVPSPTAAAAGLKMRRRQVL